MDQEAAAIPPADAAPRERPPRAGAVPATEAVESPSMEQFLGSIRGVSRFRGGVSHCMTNPDAIMLLPPFSEYWPQDWRGVSKYCEARGSKTGVLHLIDS